MADCERIFAGYDTTDDLDGDGLGDHCDIVPTGDDCDDYAAAIYPGAPEVCDGTDNDCDGVADAEECDP